MHDTMTVHGESEEQCKLERKHVKKLATEK